MAEKTPKKNGKSGLATCKLDSTTSAALEYLEWSKEHTEETLGFAESIQQLLAPCLAQMDKAVESHPGEKKFGKNLMILEDPQLVTQCGKCFL